LGERTPASIQGKMNKKSKARKAETGFLETINGICLCSPIVMDLLGANIDLPEIQQAMD